MNTKAMISLDELVNKPDSILQKLEKYRELVLIWNNVPYCVVTKVPDEEEEGLTVFQTQEAPLPIASKRFAQEAEKETTPMPAHSVQETAGQGFWFAGMPSPVEEQPPVVEAPIVEQPIKEEPKEEVSQEVPPVEEPPAEEASEESVDLATGEVFSEPAPLDYVPYEVLKHQKPNLWDVMAQVLKEHPQRTMHAVDLARVINERGLYQTRDGKPVTSIQVRARVGHRPERFEALGGNLIRLREE
ncbi:MAG: hypothetical protein ACI4U2_00155 [Christensenellaceae bacterium]